MSGVFLSVPSALHVSYMMQAYENAPQSILAKVLRLYVGVGDVWRYNRPKVVFFDDLSALEIHGQCSQIRGKVVRLLPILESSVIRSRYGLTEYEDMESGERRYAFSADRAKAMKYLAKWLSRTHGTLNFDVRKLLVARVFAYKKQTPITLRQLSEEHGNSHVFYHYNYHAIEKQLCLIEMRALDLLTPLFAERGVCNGDPVVEKVVPT